MALVGNKSASYALPASFPVADLREALEDVPPHATVTITSTPGDRPGETARYTINFSSSTRTPGGGARS